MCISLAGARLDVLNRYECESRLVPCLFALRNFTDYVAQCEGGCEIGGSAGGGGG